MRVLALDTALAMCSVALWRDGEIEARASVAMARGHAEALVPMIERTLGSAGHGYRSLDRIGVTVGPGYFTGVRVGLATARGLALALRVPAAGVTTFEAVAVAARAALPEDTAFEAEIVVAFGTKRAEIFIQRFDATAAALAPAAAMDLDSAAAWPSEGALYLAGDAAGPLAGRLPPRDVAAVVLADCVYPDPGIVAVLAATGDAPAEPFYLQPPAATAPADGGRVRPTGGKR